MALRLKARLAALERKQEESKEGGFRLVVSLVTHPANLATSTCTRTRGSTGGLVETVRLDGSHDSVTDAELESFIQNFPVESSNDPESSRS